MGEDTKLGRILCLSMALMFTAGTAQGQQSLPILPQASGSTAGPTIAESNYNPLPRVSQLPEDAPNIVVIMLDDVGAALPHTFGGPITTPTLNRLAEEGIAFSRFHNAAMCSPTRASLLTGRNHHRVGNGQIAELSNDWDGYSGRIPRTSATVAKVLSGYGYATAAFGKWHNTPANETTAVGPYTNWPVGDAIGFDYFYGFLAGESSQWEPAVVENTNRIDPSHGKEGYHFTEDMAGKAVSWMKQVHALTPDRPFFVYWTPGASHGPHHIFKEWADKYKDRFDAGWDALREEVFANQKELGWIPDNTELTARPDTLAAWDDIPEDEREFQLRLMEVFAGYTEHADTQAGRLLDALDEMGVRDNTLVFYVWGDNGSSAEGQGGSISELLAQNGIPTEIKDHIRTMNELGGLDVLGSPKADNMYHAAWAWAGSTPYRSTKLVAAHFGGTRTPLVVSWPAKIAPDKKPRAQFHHVNDIVPTIYDLLEITPPETVDGVSQDPIDGVSLTYTFDNPDAEGRKRSQYFEVMGSRSYYEDGWIASVFGPRTPWVPGVDPAILKWSPDNDTWELHDLTQDHSQARNLADEHPEKVEALKEAFLVTAEDNKVFPIGGGLWSVVFHPEDAPSNPATEFTYTQEVTGVPEFTAPKVGARSSIVTIDAELTEDSEGVLYALGAYSGGLALWIEQGKLTYEYNLFQVERTRISTTSPLPTGKVTITVETTKTGNNHAAALDVVISVNGDEVAKGTVPRSAPLTFTANDTFDVGRDSYSPVSEAYFDRKPFAFNGKINRLHVAYQ